MGKAQLTLAALLVAGGACLLVASLRTSQVGGKDRPSAALERRVRDAAKQVLAQPTLRGSRLVAVDCDAAACEVEASHDDRAALASFQQQFPHRMGAIFAQSSIRSDPSGLRSRVQFSRKAERPLLP